MSTDPQATCPNCHHDQHLPGTDCDAVMGHGPNRWHRCLCLARPGAALSCPPQMTCQGGTLGYSDIWYLQHGHTLVTADGEISPEAVVQTGVMSVGFPSDAPEDEPAAPVAAPPTGQAGLRDRIADAVVPLLLDTLPKVIARARGYEVADAVLPLLPAADEPHRLALSTALGLGTSAPWDAIRERAAELAIEADRLRNEVAEAEERAETDDRVMDALNRKIRELGGEGVEERDGQQGGEAWDVSDARPGTTDHTLTQPVRHAPGVAILCPDCRAKGHSVCMVDEERAPIQCTASVLRKPHGPHGWEPQPGMDPVPCPGWSDEEPTP
ncbi:hypothetical protein ACKI14_02455 [Streptomyces turgidiscabies]|uniref:hypothetical protein n=1 Tax=Streptomyces turgidiscabies TaxID=85558 RepID=UPI0038F6B141